MAELSLEVLVLKKRPSPSSTEAEVRNYNEAHMDRGKRHMLDHAERLSHLALEWAAVLGVALIAALVRALPVDSSDPIGGDASSYTAYATDFSETWPLLPERMTYWLNVPYTSALVPLHPWLMAGLSKLPGVGLNGSVILTPLITAALTAVLVYVLTKSLTNDRLASLGAALFFATSKLLLFKTYPIYAERLEFGVLLMTALAILFHHVYRLKRSGHASHLSYKFALGGISLCIVAITASHDLTLAALAVALSVFFTLALLLNGRGALIYSIPLLGALAGGAVLSMIIIVPWWGYFQDHWLRFSSGVSNPEAAKAFYESVISRMPLVYYGYLPSFFGLIGVLALRKRIRDSPGLILILSWGLSAYVLSLPFVAYSTRGWRFIDYVVVPLSIFAGAGLSYFVRITARHVSMPAAASFLAAPLLILAVFTFQVSDAAHTLVILRSPQTYLSAPLVESLDWLEQNTPEGALIITSHYANYGSEGYIPALTRRPLVFSLGPQVFGSSSSDYTSAKQATDVLTFKNPDSARAGVEWYEAHYTGCYILLEKRRIPWARANNEPLDLSKLRNVYETVYESTSVVIFKVCGSPSGG